jgi:hypothetical protein
MDKLVTAPRISRVSASVITAPPPDLLAGADERRRGPAVVALARSGE